MKKLYILLALSLISNAFYITNSILNKKQYDEGRQAVREATKALRTCNGNTRIFNDKLRVMRSIWDHASHNLAKYDSVVRDLYLCESSMKDRLIKYDVVQDKLNNCAKHLQICASSKKRK